MNLYFIVSSYFALGQTFLARNEINKTGPFKQDEVTGLFVMS